MITLTFTIDTDHETPEQAFSDFADGRRYEPIILVKNFQVPNPETKEEFTRRQIGLFFQGTVHQGKVASAIISASQAVPKPVVNVDGKPVSVQPVPAEMPKDAVPVEEVPVEPVFPV